MRGGLQPLHLPDDTTATANVTATTAIHATASEVKRDIAASEFVR